jgi:hypothetical protein
MLEPAVTYTHFGAPAARSRCMKKFQFDFGHSKTGIAEGQLSSESLQADTPAPRDQHQYVT